MLAQLLDDKGQLIESRWNWPHYILNGVAIFEILEPCIACGARFLSSGPFVEVVALDQCYEFQAGESFTLKF